MSLYYYVISYLFILTLIACNQKEATITPASSLMSIPPNFPEPIVPQDNQFSYERWLLGKKLFYDKRLSKDGTVSCASCHNSNLAFADNTAVSFGVANRAGSRNSPSLANVAYHPYFTREGGVPSLEMQILVPIQEHNEFDENILNITDRLSTDTSYQRLAQEAYNRDFDYFALTRAIACFERSLISGYSPYDLYNAYGQHHQLSESAKKGLDLFFSDRTQCSSCHSGFNFTNYAFENNGLYQYYDDPGRFRLTNNPIDSARFKVPSLRNIAVTAPYMHDGSLNSLYKVIEHYNRGGFPHRNKSSFIKPLNLSEEEKEALIAFLNSLTDESFINNRQFKE